LAEVGGLGGGSLHSTVGPDLLGHVSCRSSIAEKSPSIVEKRVAADRKHPFAIIADLSSIDEVTEGLVPVEK
jgi:hypothetical protein